MLDPYQGGRLSSAFLCECHRRSRALLCTARAGRHELLGVGAPTDGCTA